MREIVEADVVQAQGDVLYVLNRYRGLVLIDMSQPDSPYVIGRVPFQAQPVDMYLRDKRAYIVMSDYLAVRLGRRSPRLSRQSAAGGRRGRSGASADAERLCHRR